MADKWMCGFGWGFVSGAVCVAWLASMVVRHGLVR